MIPARRLNFAGYFLGVIMNKFYKIFISSIYIVAIISTSVLFAGPEQRRGLVTAIGSLFCGNTYQQQESVIDFLSQLHVTDDKAFHQLFDYVVNKKGNLDFKLAQVLTAKNLIDKTGAPSESLKQTFIFLKAIIDDYNQENTPNCCTSCCTGCIAFWRGENGMKWLKFTINNCIILITTITSKKTIKKTIPSPHLAPIDQSREIEIHAFDIEIVLKQLSGDIID